MCPRYPRLNCSTMSIHIWVQVFHELCCVSAYISITSMFANLYLDLSRLLRMVEFHESITGFATLLGRYFGVCVCVYTFSFPYVIAFAHGRIIQQNCVRINGCTVNWR